MKCCRGRIEAWQRVSDSVRRRRMCSVLTEPMLQAASAARVKSVSTIKRWLDNPEFRAMVRSSPDIRRGAPPKVGERRGVPESQRSVRSRMWVGAENQEVLGSYIPPAAFEIPTAVLHAARADDRLQLRPRRRRWARSDASPARLLAGATTAPAPQASRRRSRVTGRSRQHRPHGKSGQPRGSRAPIRRHRDLICYHPVSLESRSHDS